MRRAGSRGRFFPVSAALPALLCVAAVACEGPGADDGEGPAADAQRGGAAVVGVSTGVGTVLPPLARTSLDGEVSALLYPGLNRARWSEGRLAFRADHPMALAEGWSFGPDSTTITFRLRPDLTWSDGTPLTAGDVAFTYRLLADPDAALPFSHLARRTDSVTARGDSAVAFHFARRYPGMLFDASVGVLPEHVYGDVPPGEFMELAGRVGRRGAGDGGEEGSGGDGAEAADGADPGPVVGGPFRLAEWSRGERLLLVRNPRGPVAPRLDTLVFRVLPEEATRVAELRSGGVDMARIESFRRARRLADREGFRVHRMRRRAYDYIAWNPEGHPAFSEPRVREALSLAIDRRAVVEGLQMEPWAEPAAGPYGPLFPHLRVEPETSLHDRERARRLLDEAGWTLPEGSGDGGGVRTKEGRELSFELTTSAGSDRRTAAVEIIRSQLAEVGVRAEIRTQEFNSLFGRMRAGDYEAALLGWQIGLDPDISQFWYRPDAPLNVVAYDDARVRALMDSARAAATEEEAAPYWRRAARRIASDHPYAFLWYFDVLWASGPRLRGVEADVLGFARNAHEWWVRAGDRSPPADTSP